MIRWLIKHHSYLLQQMPNFVMLQSKHHFSLNVAYFEQWKVWMVEPSGCRDTSPAVRCTIQSPRSILEHHMTSPNNKNIICLVPIFRILCPQGISVVMTTVPHLQWSQIIPVMKEFPVTVSNVVHILFKQLFQATALCRPIFYTPTCALIGIIYRVTNCYHASITSY